MIVAAGNDIVAGTFNPREIATGIQSGQTKIPYNGKLLL
jgi:hypothetical protein